MMEKQIAAMRLQGIGIENDGKNWSKEDRKKLMKGFAIGTGISEMARQLHRSERAVMMQLITEGCYKETTKHRRSSGKQRKCLCYQCEFCKTCRYSPKNRKGE